MLAFCLNISKCENLFQMARVLSEVLKAKKVTVPSKQGAAMAKQQQAKSSNTVNRDKFGRGKRDIKEKVPFKFHDSHVLFSETQRKHEDRKKNNEYQKKFQKKRQMDKKVKELDEKRELQKKVKQLEQANEESKKKLKDMKMKNQKLKKIVHRQNKSP